MLPLYVCLLLLLLPARAGAQAASTAQADSTTLRLAGLQRGVTVRRDARGVPYIEAANEADLSFAQGYVTASDRLWQMELLRRTARGELAEILGPGPNNSVLEGDKQHRRYGFAQLSEAQVGQMPPALRAALEAYARGVNAYIESLDARSLPPEFQLLQLTPRPWRPADSLVIAKLFDEVLSTSWYADIMRAAFAGLPQAQRDALFPETSPLDVLLVGSDRANKKGASSLLPDARPNGPALKAEALGSLAAQRLTARLTLERVGLYAADSAASNSWVVSGAHTVSGKPLLANDPHLSPSAPSIWYMTHLSVPGSRMAGVSVAGLPGIAIGHNEQIAWGITSLEPDVQDLYVEKFEAANPRRYQTPTGWREAEVRHEEIKVRKGFTGNATESVPFDVLVTRHGPIIYEKGGQSFALRWTALDPQSNLLPSFYRFSRARNWDEFRAALRDYSGPAFNMIYADVKGHIGYYGAGRFPIRKTGRGALPYDGSTDAGEWTGFIPFDALPHLYDPPSGIIITANSRIVGHDYPYQLTAMPLAAYRARRIDDLLRAKAKMTIDDFRAVQGDTYSIPGTTFARELVKVANESPAAATGDEGWRAAVRLLSEWDGRVVPESRAALMVAHLREAFGRRVLAGTLGAELARQYSYSNSDTFLDRVITERPREWLPREFKSYAELLRACYADARAELSKRFGADESLWAWGRQAQVRFPHPLAGVPVIGQQFVIPPFPQNGAINNLTTINRGPNVSMRLIADAANWDRTQQGITLGQSGIPSSPHWKDQLEDWRNVTPPVFPFNAAAVERATRATLRLEPAQR
jgi:penicillin amidase